VGCAVGLTDERSQNALDGLPQEQEWLAYRGAKIVPDDDKEI
jgi:hypothetical protein